MDSFPPVTATAYIVEDEPKARELLGTLLAKRHPQVRLVGEAPDVHTAAEGSAPRGRRSSFWMWTWAGWTASIC